MSQRETRRVSLKENPVDWIGEQANQLQDVISSIEAFSHTPGSSLTPDQIRNVLGHILLADKYDSRLGNDLSLTRGAMELTWIAGHVVAAKAPEYRELFTRLARNIREAVVGAHFRVMRHRSIPELTEPEDTRIYQELSKYGRERDHKKIKMCSEPDFGEINTSTTFGNLTFDELQEWLISQPTRTIPVD